MSKWTVGDKHFFDYSIVPMPEFAQKKKGDRLPIMEHGKQVASVEVTDSNHRGYNAVVITTYNHHRRRGPSEIKA